MAVAGEETAVLGPYTYLSWPMALIIDPAGRQRARLRFEVPLPSTPRSVGALPSGELVLAGDTHTLTPEAFRLETLGLAAPSESSR